MACCKLLHMWCALCCFLNAQIFALEELRYAAFTQTATYSIASQLGIFRHYGLNFTYLQIPNSTYAYAELISGGYDIVSGTIDNAVNNALNLNQSLTVLGQLDGGPDLVIASIPSITSIQPLRGKTIIVDSPLSGFAYVLQKVLSLFGLRLSNNDYAFQTVGATNIRFADLVAGMLPNGSAVHATILTYPFVSEITSLPLSQQPNILAQVSDLIRPYSSSALTIASSSMADPMLQSKLVKFFTALLAASSYLGSSSATVTAAAVSAIAATLDVSTAIAELAYQSACNNVTGELPLAMVGYAVDSLGLLNVIDVRDEFGGFRSLYKSRPKFNFVEFNGPGTGKFIDYRVRTEALSTLSLSL